MNNSTTTAAQSSAQYLSYEEIKALRRALKSTKLIDDVTPPEGNWIEVREKPIVRGRLNWPIYVDYESQRWRVETYSEYLKRTKDYYS